MDSNTIGNRIKALREIKGKTQAEVAEALHVKRQTVDQWENGTRDLKTQYTIDLAVFFDVSCDEILRGVKAENISINQKIGLSDRAVEIMESVFRPNSDYTAIANKLIENNSLEHLCHEIQIKLSEGMEYDSILDNANSSDMKAQLTNLPVKTAELIQLLTGVLHDNTELFYEFRMFRLTNILNGIVELTYNELVQDELDKQVKQSKMRIKQYEKMKRDATETDNNGESS